MSEMCRPLRRLFLCALVLLAREGLAQTVPMTTVQDTVYRADGSPAQGTLLISWPDFTTSGGQAIAAGTTSVTLGAGGALSVALVPNANATPPSTVYTVVYQLDDGTVKTEYWVVPTTSPATLAAVRTTLGATSSVAQMATQQFVNSALATKANDTAVVHLAGTETITGVKQFAVSPSLPSPVQPTDAASKSYVDSAVQNVGSGSYLSTSGGTLTGPLTLSGDPVAPNQAATKHYTDISTAVKADLIGGLVPPTELASGTPSGSTCLLGNQTWGSCGAGGSSSYINNTLIANPNFNSAVPSPQSNFLNCSFQNTGSDVSLQCPYGNTSSTFALGSQAVLNNQANTYGAGLQDFSAASLRLPSGAGYAPATSGAIGFDTTANAPVINISGVTQQLALTTSNISGQASTALALAATPAQCNGSFATGVQANGNANCTTAGVIQLAETSQPAGIPNYGIFWFDSATHTPRIIDNNGQVEQLALLNVFNTDANTLEEYNGSNPQTLNVYGTRTDASDYERASLGYDTADSYFFLGADAAGTGTQRGLGFWLQGSLRWVIDSAFNFKPWSDNIKDIGTPTLRVHNLYLGTGLVLNSGTLTGVHGTTGVAAEAGTLGTTAGAGLCNDGNGNITDQGCTSGAVSSVFGRSGVVVPQTGDYSVSQVTGAAPLASPAFSGTATAPTQSPLDNSTKIATTGYADSAVGVEKARAQAAEALLAPLASPALTGTPTAPTPSLSDSSTRIATTAWVQSNFNNYAELTSPAFTGTPTAPTPATSDSSTKIATTAWVNAQGYGTGAGNVSGPASSASGDIASFNGTNGKTIQDSGVAVSSLAPLASPTFTGTATLPDGSTNSSSGYSFAHALTLPNGSTTTTPPTSDSSTKIATTAWVNAQGYGTGMSAMSVGEPIIATGSNTGASSAAWIDATAPAFAGSDMCASIANALVYACRGGTVDARGFGKLGSGASWPTLACGTNPLVPTGGVCNPHAEVLLPSALIETTVQWVSGSNGVSVIGKGASVSNTSVGGTVIQAVSGFPTSSCTNSVCAIIEIGDTSHDMFDTKVSELSLDCNSIANCWGYWTAEEQELGGLYNLKIFNIGVTSGGTSGGAMFDSTVVTGGNGTANFDIKNMDVDSVAAPAQSGVYGVLIKGNSAHGPALIDNLTAKSLCGQTMSACSGKQLPIGLDLDGVVTGIVHKLHAEAVIDGIRYGDTASSSGVVVDEVEGNQVTTTNLVHIHTATSGRFLSMNATGGTVGSNTAILDDTVSLSIPDALSVPAYQVGGAPAHSYWGNNTGSVAGLGFVQPAVSDVTGAAPSASPVFTGTPTAPTPSPGDSSTKIATTAYVQGQTTSIPWLTVPRAGSNSGVTFSTSANQAYWWGVVLTFPVTTTQITYYVGTADNTADSYDVGIYDSSGNLRVHTGSKAGTTFAPGVGAYTLAWISSATLQPGKYYLAITTNCTASCAALAGDNASAVTFLSKAAVSVTTGGTLNGPIAPPADAWNFASYVPAWAVH